MNRQHFGSVDWLSRQARDAWSALLAAPGIPRLIDVPVLVRLEASATRPGRIVLQTTTEGSDDLGLSYVFHNEWYPDCGSSIPYSHYEPTLRRVLTALERRGETEPLRLQVLKAVATVTPAGRTLVALLKFIIAPEYTLTGAQLEEIYGCPLSAFYTKFVGVAWDPQRNRSVSGSVRGEAIHEGYRRAASLYVATGDAEQAKRAYLDGVRATWLSRMPNLFLDRPTKPKADYTRPIEAAGPILHHCGQSWPERGNTRLLQERLFYSPTRGISGRADRIEQPDASAGPAKLVEVKSGGSFGGERDPRTGEERPGGLQSLSYREIMRSFGVDGLETVIEQIADGVVLPTDLERHPLATRLKLQLTAKDERAIDLIAQCRNVGYCVVSGLYSGYDRHLLDGAAGTNRFLGAVGGDFDLYKGRPPCRVCAARARGVCAQAAGSGRQERALYNLFRYAPGYLFAYWAWYHRQLKAEEQIDRRWLYHLVATPAASLERDEGVTITDLELAVVGDYDVLFRRESRIETRIREDERVLVTPLDRLPGQMISIEGTVTSLGEREIGISLRDRLDHLGGRFRIDALGAFEMRPWQVEGLSDFLIAAMSGVAARGRQIAVDELPRLAQILLGKTEPAPLRQGSLPAGVGQGLNEPQRRAISAALALEPGNLMLIQGPPGTGKTSLIAHLARAVLARHFFDYDGEGDRRPLLILANTHRAANEVVRKLINSFPELQPFVVRTGSRQAVREPEVAEQLLAERVGAREALEAVDLTSEGPETLVRLIRKGNRYHDEAGIFVGTLGAGDAAELRGLAFEMVIVDETGQATEPAMLQALRHLPVPLNGRLVLVGDHQQLPPVVAHELEAPAVPESYHVFGLRQGDSLRTSAFERLARLYPEALLTLSEQYRMNAPIDELISRTFYDGKLRPGTDAVAERRLSDWFAEGGLPAPSGLIGSAPPIVLVDTSADPSARDSGARFNGEGARDDARDNGREARLIAQLIAELLAGMPRERWPAVIEEIGVISPYRKQNNRLLQELMRIDPALKGVRVDTVDRFQGGEREIIIVSLVNSNAAATIGPLHADWRRMNVALSRARRTLVIVGNRETFSRQTERPEEVEAKARYRELFRVIDDLAVRGQAQIVPSHELGAVRS